jgi:hypothetical protein
MHMAVILCRMEAPQVKMQYMIWLEVTRYNVSWFLSLKLYEDAANGCTGQVDMMELKHQINRAIATVTRGISAMSGKKLSISWTSVMSLIAAHWEIYQQKFFEMSLMFVFNVVQYLHWLINWSLIKSHSHQLYTPQNAMKLHTFFKH